jgi:hypothetical protein
MFIVDFVLLMLANSVGVACFILQLTSLKKNMPLLRSFNSESGAFL